MAVYQQEVITLEATVKRTEEVICLAEAFRDFFLNKHVGE